MSDFDLPILAKLQFYPPVRVKATGLFILCSFFLQYLILGSRHPREVVMVSCLTEVVTPGGRNNERQVGTPSSILPTITIAPLSF